MKRLMAVVFVWCLALGAVAQTRTVTFNNSTHALASPPDFFVASSNKLDEAISRDKFTNFYAATLRYDVGTNVLGATFLDWAIVHGPFTNGAGGAVFEANVSFLDDIFIASSGSLSVSGLSAFSGAVQFGSATPWVLPDGIRQTFNPNGTAAGINVGAHTADPSTPVNGDLWYDSTANELTARINGANVSLGAAGAGVSDGDKGDITVSGSGATWTIDNAAVTLAKMANLSAPSKLIGRYSGGAGAPQEITISTGLSLDGSGNLTSTGTGVAAKANDILVTGSFSLTNRTGTAAEVSTTWGISTQAEPAPDLITLLIGTASITEAGIVSAAGGQSFAGAKTWTGGSAFRGTTATTNDSPAIFNGSINIPPVTNLTFSAINVATNPFVRVVTNADFTITFTGTALDGDRRIIEVINTATTNLITTIPSAKSRSFGGTATTTVSCFSNNAATTLSFQRISGEWWLDVSGRDVFITDFGPNLAASQVLSVHAIGTASTPTIMTNVAAGGATVDDTAFASSWNGVTGTAPSKNAVYDWGHIFDTDDDGKVNVVDLGAGLVKSDAGGVLSAATVGADYATHTSITNIYEFALSDETTAITTGTAKLTWRAPHAMTIKDLRASLTTASSSGIPTVDINESGTTIISTKLTIDANEKTSTTAAAAYVLSDSAIADDAEITFDIDVAGTGAAGLKVKIYYTR